MQSVRPVLLCAPPRFGGPVIDYPFPTPDMGRSGPTTRAMGILDRFKTLPKWKHADADVRLAGVHELPEAEQDVLAEVARTDADPRVRKAAVGKLGAVGTLSDILRSDADEAVRDEAAGVIAHELAHIRNRDTLLMTITATIAGAISMLAQFGMFFGGGHREGNNGIGVIGTLAMIVLAPLAAVLVQMAISRTREYAADNLGARISGNPRDLASALERIDAAAHHIENIPAEQNPATAHLFIINPLSGARMDNLFSTHPATQNRIAALEQLAAQMGQARRAQGPEFRPSPAGPWGARGPWG